MTTMAHDTPAADATSAWRGFRGALWQRDIDVRAFIQLNYEPYEGDAPSSRRRRRARSASGRSLERAVRRGTQEGRARRLADPEFDHRACARLHRQGQRGHRRPADRRAAQARDHAQRRLPDGGQRARRPMATTRIPPSSRRSRSTARRTTMASSTPTRPTSASAAAPTSSPGLPDAYGRGRIIGDYRRVALYGVARLIQHKQEEKAALDAEMSTESIIRDREELAEQIRALKELQQMAKAYGFDISVPARTAKEAVQWLYFGYLAAVKEQNGAAMSLGRTSTFLDIYFQRDLAEGTLTESRGAGDHRRRRHQAAHRPLPAHARVRRAVRGRPDLGHRVDRRDGRRRPAAGHQDQLPRPADALQPRSRTRAQPHHPLLAAPAGGVPALRHEGRDRHQLAAVRERRD